MVCLICPSCCRRYLDRHRWLGFSSPTITERQTIRTSTSLKNLGHVCLSLTQSPVLWKPLCRPSSRSRSYRRSRIAPIGRILKPWAGIYPSIQRICSQAITDVGSRRWLTQTQYTLDLRGWRFGTGANVETFSLHCDSCLICSRLDFSYARRKIGRASCRERV